MRIVLILLALCAASVTPASAQAPTDQCRALFVDSTQILEPYVRLTDRPSEPPNEEMILRGVADMDRAIGACPNYWQALWFKGKAFQALGDHAQALRAFQSAYAIEKHELPVVNEMTIEAVEVGQFDFALQATQEGLAVFPNSLELRARAALALLFEGRLDESIDAANRALEVAPGDQITLNIIRVAGDIKAGRMAPPHSMAELLATASR